MFSKNPISKAISFLIFLFFKSLKEPKCMNCQKSIKDSNQFIEVCRQNKLSIDESTLDIQIGGLFVGGMDDYFRNASEKKKKERH